MTSPKRYFKHATHGKCVKICGLRGDRVLIQKLSSGLRTIVEEKELVEYKPPSNSE